MSYNEFINNIIETRGRFGITEGYKERHHITPRCMNGTNEDDNLIDLYAREHLIAHRLLAEENPNNYKLLQAYVRMGTGINNRNEQYKLTPEEYEDIRVKCIEANTIRWSLMSEEERTTIGRHISEGNKGRKLTEEQKQNMRGIPKSEATKEKISTTLKEKYANDEEFRLKNLETLSKNWKSGEENPMYGKKMSEDTKQHMRDVWHETHDGCSYWIEYNNTHKGKDHPCYGTHHSEETKAKQSARAKESYTNGRIPSGSKSIRCVETKEVFVTMKEACEKLHTTRNTLKVCIKNKSPNAKGLHFEYLQEVV